MENRTGIVNQGSRSSSSWSSYRRSEEFQEEDVWNNWNVTKEDRNFGFEISENKALTSPLSVPRRLPSAARMIPGNDRHQVDDSDKPIVVLHSAPVSIPDWSKIYGNVPTRKGDSDSSSVSPRDHDSRDHKRYSNDFDVDNVDDDAEESDEDDEEWDGYDNGDGDRTPPHEWLAKKLARSQISSFSVCEGAGRTLKGRDLSRVRHAVLSKTGFI